MKLKIDDLYNLVSDLISREDFDTRIRKYNEDFSELIEPEVLAHLIVDELGRNLSDFTQENDKFRSIEFSDISSITNDGPVNLLGTISWLGQLKTFNRKNNTTGYVFNLELYDGTGSIRVTLWDDNAKYAEKFKLGEHLKIINGYSKIHNTLREVHSNYRTKLILE